MTDDLVKRLRLGACALEIEQAADRIEELEAERDEARRMFVHLKHKIQAALCFEKRDWEDRG